MKIKLELDKTKYEGEVEEVNEPTSYELLHAIDQTEIFVVCEKEFDDDKKHWVEDEKTFNELGRKYDFGWGNVPKPITLEEINEHLTGDTVRWDKDKQEFVVGTKARDIYFPQEPEPNGMKGTWCELDRLGEIREAGFNTVFSFNWASHNRDRQERTLASAKENGIGYIAFLGHLLRDHGLARVEEIVMEFMNHEAIVGWLLYDEPQLQRISVSKQLAFYKAITAIDSMHPMYTAFMANDMKPEYYDPETFDRLILTYYPFRNFGNWEDHLKLHLDRWIESTGNKDVYPNMQGCKSPKDRGDLVSPLEMMEAQYEAWLARGMGKNCWLIYAWQDGDKSGSRGISEIPGLLEEVTKFNKARR